MVMVFTVLARTMPKIVYKLLINKVKTVESPVQNPAFNTPLLRFTVVHDAP